MILNAVASRPLEPFDRSVDSMVVRLRRKIEPDLKQPRLIVTVPGEGYRFDGLERCASRLDLKAADLDPTEVKNIAEPVQVYSLEVGQPAEVKLASAGMAAKPESGRPAPRIQGWSSRWPAASTFRRVLVVLRSRACRHLTPAEPQHPERDQRQAEVEPRHLQPTAVGPLTFALSVRRGVVRC